MLNYKKNITVTGGSYIDRVQAEGYTATISSDNPEDIVFSNWQTDKALYKANRSQCRKDAAEFEDVAYAIQDEMIAEKQAVEKSE